jgi:hypothetical protein
MFEESGFFVRNGRKQSQLSALECRRCVVPMFCGKRGMERRQGYRIRATETRQRRKSDDGSIKIRINTGKTVLRESIPLIRRGRNAARWPEER